MNKDKGNAAESTMDTGYRMGSTKGIPASMPAGGLTTSPAGAKAHFAGGKKTVTK